MHDRFKCIIKKNSNLEKIVKCKMVMILNFSLISLDRNNNMLVYIMSLFLVFHIDLGCYKGT